VEFRFPYHRGPLNSTRTGMLNHHTSKISINSIWMKISLCVYEIRGFEGGIQVSISWGTPKFHQDGVEKSPKI
jgi:hypothetical protein